MVSPKPTLEPTLGDRLSSWLGWGPMVGSGGSSSPQCQHSDLEHSSDPTRTIRVPESQAG